MEINLISEFMIDEFIVEWNITAVSRAIGTSCEKNNPNAFTNIN